LSCAGVLASLPLPVARVRRQVASRRMRAAAVMGAAVNPRIQSRARSVSKWSETAFTERRAAKAADGVGAVAATRAVASLGLAVDREEEVDAALWGFGVG